MKGRHFAGVAVAAVGLMLAGRIAFSQSQPPTQGAAVGETPAWFLQGSFPDPGGRTIVDPGGHVTVPPLAGVGGRGASGPGAVAERNVPAVGETPGCRRSPLCGNPLGGPRPSLPRGQWKQT